MGYWSYYFLIKLYLYSGKYVDFHFWPNLGFALFVALPARKPWQRALKHLVAVPAGIALLYHDSWLPPLDRALAQKDQLIAFSFTYFIELMQRFIDWKLVLTLFAMLAVWMLLRRRVRMSTFALLGVLGAGLVQLTARPPALPAMTGDGEVVMDATQALTPAALNQRLERFYQNEARRRVELATPAASAVPFDIIYLQVCSLAWDDLRHAGSDNHPLLQKFDVLMTRFDAAASYSGPAAIRLLRSGCGQPHHEELYAPAAPDCYLHNQFQRIGYEPQWAMNHRGIFGNMAEDIRVRGRWDVPLVNTDGIKPAMKSFDAVENGYLGDYDVLARWWQQRLKSEAPRVALYYNTGSLHDGNRFLDGSKPNAQESYRRRAAMLFGDIERFMNDIAASGRHAVVVLIPEHGAALRGDRRQLSGLREIPTPAITQIPVGIRLVGRTATPQQRVETPTSFTALSETLNRLLAQDPFADNAPPLTDLTKDLPQTEPVAENDGTVILQLGGVIMMRTPDGEWSRYDTGK